MKRIIAILLLLIFFFSIPLNSVKSSASKVKGANIVYYWKCDWNNVSTTLDRLKSDGINFISICVIWYQDTKFSTQIKPDGKMTPDNKEVIQLIELAHQKGFNVLLRPYINIKSGETWEGNIDFGNSDALWNEWFKSYENFILHYAVIAEKENVELFSVGAELVNTVKRESNWRDVIRAVRSVYRGKILYTANSGNEDNVNFFDAVDYIGVDAYYTLTDSVSPSESEFENAWKEKYIPYLKVLSEKYNKKIIITEVGYRSIDSAYINPWDYNKNGKVDYSMQKELFEAFFNTIFKEDFVKGAFLWYAPPSLEEYKKDFGHYYKYDYAFFDKPAELVIKDAFSSASYKNPLLDVKIAAAYYVDKDTPLLEELSEYADLLILQTRFLPLDVVKRVSEKTLVAGYVSVLEFDGEKEDFNKYELKNAVMGKNNNWGSLIMNINDKNYQDYLIGQTQKVFESGAQGVFLDTIDDVNDYPVLKDGTVKFIKMLHRRFPDKFFIMNRGFTVLDDVVDSIQGVLFEDFGTYYNFDKKCYMTFSGEDMKWEEEIASKLRDYQNAKKIRVIASGYASSPFSPLTLYSELLSREYGFAFYCSNLDITDLWFHFAYPFPHVPRVFAE